MKNDFFSRDKFRSRVGQSLENEPGVSVSSVELERALSLKPSQAICHELEPLNYDILGSGCGTAVEHTPAEQNS